MQDVDKLKNILLNYSQRFFFYLIPKPEISNTNKSAKKLSISESNIRKVKLKRMTKEKILENYERFCENYTEIDERILKMLDEKTSKNINLSHFHVFGFFFLYLSL